MAAGASGWLWGAGYVVVELAQRIGVAGRILKPVHVTRILQRHLTGMRKPASDDLGAVCENIGGAVQDQRGSLIARCSLERVQVFP
jgi:hypothetical protein